MYVRTYVRRYVCMYVCMYVCTHVRMCSFFVGLVVAAWTQALVQNALHVQITLHLSSPPSLCVLPTARAVAICACQGRVRLVV